MTRNITAAELLDLEPWVGQRRERYRFDVLDRTLAKIGTVTPRSSCSVELNVHATIKRQLHGFHLAPSDAAAINPLTDRIQPVMELPEADEEFPLGVFLFATARQPRTTRGRELEATLFDQGLILNQAFEWSYGVLRGTPLTSHLEAIADEAGVPSTSIQASGRTAGNSLAWLAGRDTRTAAMNAIADLLGYYSPYFDNRGTLVARPVPELATAAPDHWYPEGDRSRIIRDTIEERDDLLEAANTYVAVSTSATGVEISGTYSVPASAPHSRVSRGFAVVQTIDAPGLESSAAATEMAQARAAQDYSTYRWVEFSAPPDPRHDTFDIVSYLAEGNFREQGWTLTCQPGGPHVHRLRRLYQ